MFKELRSIFIGNSPLKDVSKDFAEMLGVAQEMVLEASAVYWSTEDPSARTTALRKKDVQVNVLERQIRKKAAAHLMTSSGKNVSDCLVMMSLVKDVERLGDYAKNLAEAAPLIEEPLPDDELTRELKRIGDSVEEFSKEVSGVLERADADRAKELTLEGRSVAKRCDALLEKVAESGYSAGLAVKMTLGARYYKRLGSHLLNLISSLIMPLHKLDYFDEDSLS